MIVDGEQWFRKEVGCFMKGRSEGKAEALWVVLEARGLRPSAAQRARIERCQSSQQLQTWLRRAALAKDVMEVFRRVRSPGGGPGTLGSDSPSRRICDDRPVTAEPTGPSFPARLHVLLARSSAQAVVIRRGPSKHVCVIGWDRTRDTFEDGQWLKGRIYERRCDLSPDGRYLIYFAMNGHWKSQTGGSWTAISRAPYLRALVLLGKGDGWHGGGLFTGPGRYWLNDGYGHRVLRDDKQLRRDLEHVPQPYYGGECPGVYYHRLLRDGWSLREHIDAGRMQALTVFEKDLGGGWILRKLAHEEVGAPVGKGCYWDEHELEHAERGVRIACPDWEWAERDGGRLVYASRGCLYRVARPKGEAVGLAEATLLRDFNGMRFVARPAPYRV